MRARACDIYRGDAHKVLLGKHEGKRPLGKHGHQRYNIKNGSPRNGFGGGGRYELNWLRIGTGGRLL